MTEGQLELSIVIPARNDDNLLSAVLERVQAKARNLSVRFELIVIDANSTDNTAALAREKGARVVQLSHRPAYGEILQLAFKEAKGTHVMVLDADLLPDYDILSRFWERRNQSELLIGSRYIAGGSARMPVLRTVLSRLSNRLYGIVLSLPFKDISSGFRMYNTAIFEDVNITCEDYSALVELILKTYANGWIIEEIPFRYEPEKFGNSTKRAFSFLRSYVRSIIRMWQLRNSVFSADYDERAFNSIIPLQRYWQRTRYRIIMSFTGSREQYGAEILDIGCGSSRIIQQLSGAVGLDIALKKLRYLRRRGVRLVKADINCLPFPDESFALVICSQVIEHVPMTSQIFREFNRVLKPGGALLVGTPDYGRASWRVIEYFYKKLLPGAYAEQHITHYTRESLSEILRDNGFNVLEHRYVGGSELIAKAEKTHG